MEVSFENAKLAKTCNSEKELKGKYGTQMAKVIQRRLTDLRDAETLAVMASLPGRCHELRENHKGKLALDLVHPVRLVFRPDHYPLPTMAGGNLDWGRVTAIEVVGIGNYHK